MQITKVVFICGKGLEELKDGKPAEWREGILVNDECIEVNERIELNSIA